MTVYLLVSFAFIEPPHILHNSNVCYESNDEFDYRDDKLQHKHVYLRLQPKPASYVARSLSAGAERLWEDLKKLTTISLNA